MIVDNADNQAVFEPAVCNALPQSENGSIVFTSRNWDVATWLCDGRKKIIQVDVMNEEESLELLTRRLDIRPPGTHSRESALQLVETLEYIPLAISQAAVYIDRLGPPEPVSTYLKLFQTSRNSKSGILRQQFNDLRRDTGASHSIINTWQISFEHLRQEQRSAADLLLFMSFFDRQGIPKFMLLSYQAQQSMRLQCGVDIKLQDNEQQSDEYLIDISESKDNNICTKDCVENSELDEHQDHRRRNNETEGSDTEHLSNIIGG